MVRFNDSFSLRCAGKGEEHVDCTNGECMIFENILYIPKLKTNILKLGNLDSQGYDILLKDGFSLFMMTKESCMPRLRRKGGICTY